MPKPVSQTAWQWFRHNVRAAWARAYVRIVGVNREPSWVIGETLLPVLSIAAYIYVYRSLGAPRDYEGFVVVGGAMTSFWFAVLWGMAAQFYWEKEMGNLELDLLAPMSRMAIRVGMAFGSMFTNTVRAATVLLLGTFVFRVEFAVVSWPLLIGVFVLTLVALYGLGMLAASLFFVYGRGGWQMFALLNEPIFLVSGFYFPVRSLGTAVAVAASVLPMTFGLDGLRQLLFPEGARHGLLPVGWEMAILAGMAVLFLWLAGRALEHMENVAKRAGTLTLKWQ